MSTIYRVHVRGDFELRWIDVRIEDGLILRTGRAGNIYGLSGKRLPFLPNPREIFELDGYSFETDNIEAVGEWL
jgi:hypothetical protein